MGINRGDPSRPSAATQKETRPRRHPKQTTKTGNNNIKNNKSFRKKSLLFSRDEKNGRLCRGLDLKKVLLRKMLLFPVFVAKRPDRATGRGRKLPRRSFGPIGAPGRKKSQNELFSRSTDRSRSKPVFHRPALGTCGEEYKTLCSFAPLALRKAAQSILYIKLILRFFPARPLAREIKSIYKYINKAGEKKCKEISRYCRLVIQRKKNNLNFFSAPLRLRGKKSILLDGGN